MRRIDLFERESVDAVLPSPEEGRNDVLSGAEHHGHRPGPFLPRPRRSAAAGRVASPFFVLTSLHAVNKNFFQKFALLFCTRPATRAYPRHGAGGARAPPERAPSRPAAPPRHGAPRTWRGARRSSGWRPRVQARHAPVLLRPALRAARTNRRRIPRCRHSSSLLAPGLLARSSATVNSMHPDMSEQLLRDPVCPAPGPGRRCLGPPGPGRSLSQGFKVRGLKLGFLKLIY